MKKVLFLAIVAALSLFAAGVTAQNRGAMTDSDTIAASAISYSYIGGTLIANARELSKGRPAKEAIEFNLRIDSLSGATAATAYLEYSNATTRPGETDGSWYSPSGLTSSHLYTNGTTEVLAIGTANTFTVNGTLTKISVRDTNCVANWARWRVVNSGATQSNRVRSWFGKL